VVKITYALFKLGAILVEFPIILSKVRKSDDADSGTTKPGFQRATSPCCSEPSVRLPSHHRRRNKPASKRSTLQHLSPRTSGTEPCRLQARVRARSFLAERCAGGQLKWTNQRLRIQEHAQLRECAGRRRPGKRSRRPRTGCERDCEYPIHVGHNEYAQGGMSDSQEYPEQWK
jgi:hypothetical protein